MSTLSSLSSHLEEEAKILRSLNESLMRIQASALGDLELLGITENEVNNAKELLISFLSQLLDSLEGSSEEPAIQALVSSIENGQMPIEDWITDIKTLKSALNNSITLNDDNLQTIELILTIISDDYAEGVKALYQGW